MEDTGRSWLELREELSARKSCDHEWRSGRVPLYVYFDDEPLLEVAQQAYLLYFCENALGRKAFPSVVSLEREIVDMALRLFHGPPDSDGTFTSGGTESLLQVLKATRDRARRERPNVSSPNVVMPQSGHATLSKGAHYLGIEVRRTSIGTDFRGSAKALSQAIDANTIMIVGSAPSYPHGVYDPIEELGQLAIERELPLHVDACLGGFLAPFWLDTGRPVPAFDFSVSGVTSLSADLHKYGFAAKGASVILYRDGSMIEDQRFEFSDWPRGLYMTDTFLGTRPAGAIASAWAVMNYLGRSGYRRIAETIATTKERLIAGIKAIDGLEVLCPSDLSILLYASSDPRLNLDALAERMRSRGWFVGRCLEPPAIHLALNPVHAPAVDDYLADLAASVQEVRELGLIGEMDRHSY